MATHYVARARPLCEAGDAGLCQAVPSRYAYAIAEAVQQPVDTLVPVKTDVPNFARSPPAGVIEGQSIVTIGWKADTTRIGIVSPKAPR